MEKRLTMLLMGLFLMVGGALAQTKVSGTVVSQEDGDPIIGASVLVVGTNVGTVTNGQGKFTLTLPQGRTQIRVTYVGMQTQAVNAHDGMVVRLGLDANSLDEVVVTAMGIKRQTKALGFSATAVDGDKISEARTSDVMSSLAGKVAGVQISTGAADPGASNSVIVRGFSSLTGSNQPLYVVDGVPLLNNASYSTSLNSTYDFGNGANAINPDDVESMTILKGAAATALYGSRAANGVIVITTKSGKEQENKAIGIEYNGGLQWEQVMRLPQMQNEWGQGWYGDKTDIENGSWGPKFDGSTLRYGWEYNGSQQIKTYKPIENNIKDFFDSGFRYSNGLSFNGATDKSSYFVSFSQISDDGIIPTSKDSYDKYTFSARGSHKTGAVTFSTSMNYAYQKNSYVSAGQTENSMYNAIMQTPRDISIVECRDINYIFNSPGYYYTPYGIMNPYQILADYENSYESERLYGKFQVDYDFLTHFKLTYRLGLDTSTGHRNTGIPNYAAMYKNTPNYDDLLSGMTGSTSQQTTRRRQLENDLMLNYTQQFGKLDVNGILGLNGREYRYSYLYGSVSNLTIPTFFNLSNSSDIPTVESYKSKLRTLGAYAQAELGWDNMLYLTLTARNDWSSTLPKDNRSYFYPGATVSWIFSEMLPQNLKDIISFGKVRAAYGKTGNDASVYMTNSVYAQAGAASSGFGNGSNFPFSKVGLNANTAGNVLGSSTLSPEMTTETEIGLNMAFLKNRLSFDVTYYNRNTDKQITVLSMDAASGYTSQNINMGKVRNRGIELLVSVTPVKVKDFKWDLSWNYTKNFNKVIDLPDELGNEANIFSLSGGVGLYAIEGKELGIWRAHVAKTNEAGQYVVDAQGLPQNSDDVVEMGTMNYKYQMGFNTTFTYKSLSLSADLDVRHGGLMFSRTKSIEYFTGNAIQTAYNDRNPFVVPNSVIDNGDGTYSENNISLSETNLYNFWNNGGFEMESYNLIDKSYMKLRQVVLSWDLPVKWFKGSFVQGMRLSFFGNNLFVWTPASNTYVDPETTSFGNDLTANFGEYSANPSSRKFGFNINVKF